MVKRGSKDSKETESTTPLFECSVLGCVEVFETFSQLELHLDVGKHTVSRLSQYDWALKFSSIDTARVFELFVGFQYTTHFSWGYFAPLASTNRMGRKQTEGQC